MDLANMQPADTEDADVALARYEKQELGTFVDNGTVADAAPDYIKIDHETGDLLIGKERNRIMEANQATQAIILSIGGLEYIEKTPVDFMNPLKWDSEEAALADGRVTRFPPYGTDGDRPDVDPFRELTMLIRSPDGAEANPGYRVNIAGSDYAYGIFSAARTNYFENMKNDRGILDTVRWYANKQVPLYRLVWKLAPAEKTYNNRKKVWYLKLTFSALLPEDAANELLQQFTTPF
jgi:hypothetical protein